MKLSVAVLATALILASPAFAKSPKVAPPLVKQCETVDLVKKVAKDVQDGTAVEYELRGDELKKLNDLIEKKSKGEVIAPKDMDALIVLSKPGAQVWAGIIFVKGCATDVFPVRPESFKKLLELSKDDGSL